MYKSLQIYFPLQLLDCQFIYDFKKSGKNKNKVHESRRPNEFWSLLWLDESLISNSNEFIKCVKNKLLTCFSKGMRWNSVLYRKYTHTHAHAPLRAGKEWAAFWWRWSCRTAAGPGGWCWWIYPRRTLGVRPVWSDRSLLLLGILQPFGNQSPGWTRRQERKSEQR